MIGWRNKYHSLFIALLMVLPLSSCGYLLTHKAVGTGLLLTANGIFDRPDVNLKEKNYAAADFLVQAMSKNIKGYQNILVKPLVESGNHDVSSPLGSYISEGVGLRLAHLGYNVWLHDVASNGNEALYPPPPKGQVEAFVLKGTYLRGRKGVDINLRVINVKTSRVVSAFDYSLPLSREVREMSQTQTRIYRVEK